VLTAAGAAGLALAGSRAFLSPGVLGGAGSLTSQLRGSAEASRSVLSSPGSSAIGGSGAQASSGVAAIAGCTAAAAGAAAASSTRRKVAGPARRAADDAYGASHTSFYTDAVAKDKYDTLEEVLALKMKDPKLQSMVRQLLGACVKITEALRVNLVTVNDSSNTFGDKQLTVDVIADDLLWDLAKTSSLICEASSEEAPEIVKTSPDGQFVLCWDPLDGSSIVDNNWAVGTIVGVWDKSTGLIGATGRDQVLSLAVLYGPRTTAFLTMDDGVYEFTLGAGDQWICSREKIQIEKKCKIFSPANLRVAQDVEGYAKLVDFYMQNKFTLRYTGGMVPDVCQQFTKRQGVFTNPTSKSSPAKLRLAFEAAPFGRLVEMAGGKTSDGVTGGSVLDVKIEAVDQRTALAIGSADEVDRFNLMVLGK
jgi:sedoheptulose-bisphosphatase